jgi:hypothetical protein
VINSCEHAIIEQESMEAAVSGLILARDLALIVDCYRSGKNGPRDVKGRENAVAPDKPMAVADRIVK